MRRFSSLVRSLIFCALAAVAIPAGAVGQDAARPADSVAVDPTIIYLVRHAETADGTGDPPLSPIGRARADRLAGLLRYAGVEAVYTTDYARTRGTARPVAAENGVEPTVYSVSNLRNVAQELRTRPGWILVVGHSNTTPALVRELGGTPISPIAETEYDRLYVVVVRGDSVRTALLRY